MTLYNPFIDMKSPNCPYYFSTRNPDLLFHLHFYGFYGLCLFVNS